jgi:hypothetical protein
MKKSFPAATFMAVPLLAKWINGCIGTVMLCGCAVVDTHQAKLDQKQLRDVLMDYTEEQILDNLIRAYNGHAIVHFDIARINAAVTSKVLPVVGTGRSITDVQTRTPTHTTLTTTGSTGQMAVDTIAKTASVVGGVVETVAKPFNYGVGAEHDNVISLDVKPVLDERQIYAAYVRFLNCHEPHGNCEANVRSLNVDFNHIISVQKWPTPPAANDVLVGPKVWKNEYYWVPKDYKEAFFALCLATVAREKPATNTGASQVKEQLEDLRSLQQQDFLSR